jgi:predicted RNA-binding Zn ribbon-like protein
MSQPGDRAPAPGRLALVQDLINTADLEAGRDRLRTVDQLEVFCVDHGLGEVGAAPADLVAALELREALRDACGAHAGQAAPGASLATLRELFAVAPVTLVVHRGGAPGAEPLAGLSGGALLTAHVAAAVLTAAADGTWRRLKTCASPPCRWAYYDHSPGGRGRWCSMSVCGARAKMRAYRARSSRPRSPR